MSGDAKVITFRTRQDETISKAEDGHARIGRFMDHCRDVLDKAKARGDLYTAAAVVLIGPTIGPGRLGPTFVSVRTGYGACQYTMLGALGHATRIVMDEVSSEDDVFLPDEDPAPEPQATPESFPPEPPEPEAQEAETDPRPPAPGAGPEKAADTSPEQAAFEEAWAKAQGISPALLRKAGLRPMPCGCADSGKDGHSNKDGRLCKGWKVDFVRDGPGGPLDAAARDPPPEPPAPAPAISADAFEADWAERAGMTVQRLRATGMRPRRCEGCGKDGCRGWRMDVLIAPHDGSPEVFHY